MGSNSGYSLAAPFHADIHNHTSRKNQETYEPLAKCSGVVREKSPGTANMETLVTCAMNFWKFGHKISVLPEFWAWLSLSTWNNILSPSATQQMSLSS